MYIHKPNYSDDIHQVGIDAFEKTVTSELENRIHEKRRVFDQVKLISAPEIALIKADPAARSALKALVPIVEEERLRFKDAKSSLRQDGLRTLSLTTRGGLSVSVPPYDVQWTSSPIDDADKNTGTFTASSFDVEGYQAAGVGLFVSTTIEEDVRFSADAIFHSQWWDWVIAAGAAATDGGIGTLVYEGANLIARNDAHLWSDTQAGNTWSSNSGDDFTELTRTSAGQTYFHMLPERQYLIWIWAWTTAAILGDCLASGTIDANVPYVILAQNI